VVRTGLEREVRVEGRDPCRVDGRLIPILAQQIHGVGQIERSAVAGCHVDIDRGLEFQQKIERLGSFAAQPLISVRQGMPHKGHSPRASPAERATPKRAPESAAGGECLLQHIESGRARQIPRTVELPRRERFENLPVPRPRNGDSLYSRREFAERKGGLQVGCARCPPRSGLPTRKAGMPRRRRAR
jgi:hypothetical protein